MTPQKYDEHWTILNNQLKKIDSFYSQHAAKFKISDTEFWILYRLYKNEKITQKEISNDFSISKQTVNSAIKDLEKKKIIELKNDKENKKLKFVHFTKTGKKFAKPIIESMYKIEQTVFNKSAEEKFDFVITFFSEQIELLTKEFNSLDK